ncbi:sensor histidine kinase [Actinomyces sp. oral taxon 170]|uniref:sensor histidine kinase n=1 Tax=Actinomyces sp. oral taxon 170 TaxID=712117 RepID=UPI000205E30E|nr:histidine kinase [Actinomyces sp. oral taxon 170]EGF50027.1 histidine kinase [Actinomyces sp. oral taxon 170 str. F0386]
MSLSDPTSPVSIRRNDVLLALAFAVVQAMVYLLVSTTVPADVRQSYVAVAASLGCEGLALVLWRSRPLLCQALVWLAEVVTSLLLPAGYLGTGYGQLVVSFGMGMRFSSRRTAALLTALSLAYSAVDIWRRSPEPWQLHMVNALVMLAIYLVPMLGGAALASSRRYEHFRQELQLREHERQLESALIQERRRLAGELHDVAAHHLAGIVVQAAALERLIDRDPQTAREAAQQLRRQAKETLSGLRSVVGLLRSDEEAEEPSPGLRDLPELVASTRALGVDIELLDGGILSGGADEADVGDAPILSPLADTAVFRVAQQAISNALQHAPGSPITVELRRAEDSLKLSVLNGSARRPSTDPGGGGTGLTVMRERADAVGGALQAGPEEGGGWRVRLVLPLTREEDT